MSFVLSRCGLFDGTEIEEAVLTLLAIEENDANWHCFAPKIDQMHFINHNTVEEDDLHIRFTFLHKQVNRLGWSWSELTKE